MTDGLHVIFGTGPVGLATMEELAGSGEQVRMVNRSGNAGLPGGVELVKGDASDPDFAARAAAGASVIYQALNPPYDRWPELFPGLQNGAVSAARASGAVLISMENLYLYGPTGGQPMTEETPFAPNTRKGAVRAVMAGELAAAHNREEIRAASVRASDFFGPRVVQSALGERVFGRILHGKSAQVIGNPTLAHSYTYINDIARVLVRVGREPSAWGRAWHVPSAETTTTNQLVDMIGEVAGVPARARPTPRFMLRILGRFQPEVHELLEMLYEFEEPFVIDGRSLQTSFGFQPTPLRAAIEATVDWYRNHFAR
ncbi:MAG: NAD-dependent epimerase/dehydratase family protein [Acidimicrobiia bacterium]|nr:NAD-dependent epimerase/dehydratase family protein [Acidimicrobiia bacterium]